MRKQKNNSVKNQKKLINLALFLGIFSISITMSSEIFAQITYPRYGLFQPYTRTRYPYRKETNKNVEYVLRNTPKFSNFFDGLEQTKMLDDLKKNCPKAPGCLTVFVPNNDAFNNAPNSIFEKYNQPKNRQKILRYHLVKGLIAPKDVDSGSKVTMEGSPIKITESSQGVYKLNSANPKYPPIPTENGVIIEIDQLLIPPDL